MRTNPYPRAGSAALRRITVAATLTATIAVASCSPTAEKQPSDGTPQTSGTPSQSDTATPEPSVEPLAPYPAFMEEAADGDTEALAKQFAKEEALIAPCMKEQGFEYIPVTFKGALDDDATDVEVDPDEPEWGSLEFAQQFGYGLVTTPWDDLPKVKPEDKEPPDENQAYVDSLSESARRAYDAALYGDPEAPGFDEAWEQITLDPKVVGCSHWAQEQVTSTQALRDPEFDELFQAISDEAYATRENTPELASLDKEWSACMADRGFVFGRPYDAQQYVRQLAIDELWADRGDKDDPDDIDIPQETLDAFQEMEIKHAVADRECAASVDYVERTGQIEHAVQQAFVDEHRAQLDALVAKYGKK